MLSLTLENHTKFLTEAIQGLFKCKLLVDCTLSAELQYIKGHKVILAACSPYFENAVENNYALVINVNKKCEMRKSYCSENVLNIKRESDSHVCASVTFEKNKSGMLNNNVDGCNEDNGRVMRDTVNKDSVNRERNLVDTQKSENNSTRIQDETQDCVLEHDIQVESLDELGDSNEKVCSKKFVNNNGLKVDSEDDEQCDPEGVGKSVCSSGALKIENENGFSAVSLLPFIKEKCDKHFTQECSDYGNNESNLNIVVQLNADSGAVGKNEIDIEENEWNFLDSQIVTNLSDGALNCTPQDSVSYATAVTVISSLDSCKDLNVKHKNICSELVSTSLNQDGLQEHRADDNVILGLENVDLNVWSSNYHGQGEEPKRNCSVFSTNVLMNTCELAEQTPPLIATTEETLPDSYNLYSLGIPSTSLENVPEEVMRVSESSGEQVGPLRNIAIETADEEGFKENQCSICRMMYPSFEFLKAHLCTDVRESQYQCSHCSKEFSDIRKFCSHVCVHAEKLPYQCMLCLKRFLDSKMLQKYSGVHAGEKNFQCTICSITFTRSQNLKRHLRIHTGERNFQCTICLKRFTESQDLKRHHRVH